MWGKKYILYLLTTALLSSCVPRSVREAESVVAQADSLWHNGQMYGVDEGDSATLAQAYETLNMAPLPFREGTGLDFSYAHACYHYGKLLRAKDDPVAAMQAFINATHSHTRDYHILGRVYSNMGSICHLAGEFPLAYDMFERSAEMYLKNGDTLSYFFLLNDMAFELAEQGMKKETYEILSLIRDNIADPYLHIKTIETRAVANKKTKQYDSTLYYTKQLLDHGCCDPSVVILRAQAFSLLGQNDSAVYYAQWVLKHSPKLSHRNNALYIIANDSKVDNVTPVRQAAADRSDVQRLLSVRQGKLSQAVQLLEQDMNSKPDWRWLYAILITLIIVGIGSFIYIRNKHKRHQLLSQQIEDLENKNKEKQLQLQAQIEDKRALIATSPNITKTLSWNNYEQMCLQVDQHFNLLASKLQNKQVLNETEIRLCILVFIGLNRAQISSTLPYARSSIGKLKDHTAKQLGTTGKNLQHFLFNMTIME